MNELTAISAFHVFPLYWGIHSARFIVIHPPPAYMCALHMQLFFADRATVHSMLFSPATP